ncbi:MAG: SRPBCC family protein [Actinomycetota bacterium]|nr:SRPBCC family protein [Actinomycetota bacterium]
MGWIRSPIALGRRLRPLGPLTYRIVAPRDVVFGIVSSPYLDRTPEALTSKLEVLERGEDMVLAAHYTRIRGFTVTTVETVRFEPPSVVHFRLVRGPVPYVVEQFVLHERDGGTELEYRGELGTDFWALGAGWGALVARRWELAVRTSLDAVKAEAERRTR